MGYTLITGATDGIGLELARLRHSSGEPLVLHGRRPLCELDRVLFTQDNYCQVDLEQADAAPQVRSWLEAHHIDRLACVVLNAGCGYVGNLAEQDEASIRRIIAVNLWSAICLTRELLPLVRRGHGKIVFIGSLAGMMAAADYAVYAASKAALDGFSRSLQLELSNDSRVKIQIIHPGAVRTNLHAKCGIHMSESESRKIPSVDSVVKVMDKIMHGTRERTATSLGQEIFVRVARWFPEVQPWIASQRRRHGNVTSPRHPASAAAPHCVISGAADGIGCALALRFAKAGYQVTGVDVNAECAAATQSKLGATGRFVIADLSTAEGLRHTLDELKSLPPANVLIHNAGINAVGRSDELGLKSQQSVLDLNLLTPLCLTPALLRQQSIRSDGSIIFISSLSQFTGYPGAAVYAATKDGVASYARSLAVSLSGKGHVLTVFPGPTRTAHARRHSPDNSREARRMPPERLAELVFRSLQHRRSVLIPGCSNWLISFLGRLFPRFVGRLMYRSLFCKLPRIEGTHSDTLEMQKPMPLKENP